MTAPEKWLLALADPESLVANLPRQKLSAEDVIWVCVHAELHGVLPATMKWLERLLHSEPERILVTPAMNPEISTSIQPMRKRLAERAAISLFLGAESQQIAAELLAAGVESIPLKGADFAARLYVPPLLRSFNDVDLLVRASDWDGVEATLTQLGYLPKIEPMKYAGGYSERVWENPTVPGALVEMHDNLVNSPTIRQGVSVRFEDLPLERGSDGHLRVTPAGLLVIAAVHAAASHSFDRLQHLCDITQIVRGRAGPIDEASLRQCLAQTGAGFSVAVGLDLVRRVFNEPKADDWLARMKPSGPRGIARLLITPTSLARSQGQRRRGLTWRRQLLRQMLKSRR
jgi:hypothetical protein